MTKASNYFGGIPTDLDIKRLRDKFPETEMKEGSIFNYNDIENILNCRRDSNRYKTVTSRWRRMLLSDYGIIVGCEKSIGFKVLNDSEKLDLSGSKIRYAERSMKRSVIVSSKVNRGKLTDEEKNRLDMYSDRASKCLAVLQIKSIATLPTMETHERI